MTKNGLKFDITKDRLMYFIYFNEEKGYYEYDMGGKELFKFLDRYVKQFSNEEEINVVYDVLAEMKEKFKLHFPNDKLVGVIKNYTEHKTIYDPLIQGE